MPGTQPAGKRLAVHARQLALKQDLQILRRHRQSLLRRLEQAHRSALADHVHRLARLDLCVTITESWYYMLTRWDAFTSFLDDGRICLKQQRGRKSHEGHCPGKKVVVVRRRQALDLDRMLPAVAEVVEIAQRLCSASSSTSVSLALRASSGPPGHLGSGKPGLCPERGFRRHGCSSSPEPLAASDAAGRARCRREPRSDAKPWAPRR